MAEPEFGLAATGAGIEPRLLRAVAEVRATTGDEVSVVRKAKALSKFGFSDNIDSSGYKTVWEGTAINDEEPLFGDPSVGNVIDTVSSASSGDSQVLSVEGHTKSGDDLTFVVQTVTLDGQNEVALSTPLHACTRAYNTSSTELTGPVYIYDNADGSSAGVPSDPSDVALYMAGSASTQGQQSSSAFTAVSSEDYWIVTNVLADAKRSGSGNFAVVLQTRSTTGVWRPMAVDLSIASTGSSFVHVSLTPAVIVPKNTYVRVLALSASGVDSSLSAEIGGYLAKVMSSS